MKSLMNIFWAICLSLFLLGQANAQIIVVKKPHKPKVLVVKTSKPGPNQIWINGHWKVKKNKYVWTKGYWVKAKEQHSWVEGRWKKVRGGWKWIPGHWKRVRK
jgi:hypothetical protein